MGGLVCGLVFYVKLLVGKQGKGFHVKRGCVGVGEMRLWKVGCVFLVAE